MTKLLNFLFLSLLAFLSLAACSLHEETNLSPNRLQLEERDFVQTLPAEELDEQAVAALARDYSRFGGGPLDLTILYDPSSRLNTAMKAGNHMARLSALFRKQGVQSVKPNILPVRGHGDDPAALITYRAYSAHAPEDCEMMAGMDDTVVDADPDYRLGCTVETVFARQIARPGDLKGQRLGGITDGRGVANVIDAHRSGALKDSLAGETASE